MSIIHPNESESFVARARSGEHQREWHTNNIEHIVERCLFFADEELTC
jgi:hypothetical protein